MKERYELLYSRKDINQSIGRLASEITANYNGDNSKYGENPLFITLMRGALQFSGKLMEEIARQAPDFHPEVDYMMTSRQPEFVTPHDQTKIIMDIAPDTEVKNRNVIIVDNVLDMGETAAAVRQHVLDMGARYVELAVLVEKEGVDRSANITADYVGFSDAPNKFLVGMGMKDISDIKEAHRWADHISIVNPTETQPQHAILAQ